MLMQTWEGFVKVARRLYNVSENELLDQMRKVGIDKIDALCHINSQPEYGMIQEELAEHFGIDRTTISRRLEKVRDKWPHIFATNQTFQYDPRKHDPHVIKKY